MSAATPFDKTKSRFEIHRHRRGDDHYAAVYFVKDGDKLNADYPICVTRINNVGVVEHVEPATYQLLAHSRHQLEWLVHGCAAFHDVETHSFLEDDKQATIHRPPSYWKKAQSE